LTVEAPTLKRPWTLVAALVVTGLSAAGRFALFLGTVGRELAAGLRYRELLFQQAMFVGNRSLPLVFITSIFVGGVSALQTSHQFQGAIPLVYVGTVIAKSVFLELGPVLTALVIGARVASSFAAEIGTMRVTEQIDALETLAIRPVRYLVVPRIVATTIMLPIVTILADAVALVGGMIVAVARVGISTHTYTRGMRLLFDADDVYGGLIKSIVFGAVIAMSGCYYGFQASGGAEGVGEATTRAVVVACVLILVTDYFLAEVILRLIFPD